MEHHTIPSGHTSSTMASANNSNQELYGRVVSDVLDKLDILSAPSNKSETSKTVSISNTDESTPDNSSSEENNNNGTSSIKEVERKEEKKDSEKRRTSAAAEGEKSRPRKKQAVGPTNAPGILRTKWDEMFDRLVEYKKKHGDCLVPNRYAEDRSLGAWVSTQRRQYKLLTSRSSSSTPMCPDRARRLNEIGFVWHATDPRHTPWMQRYEELLEFHRTYGHSLVPIGFSDNVQLANWVSTQRQDYKNFCDGKSGRINKKRIKLLNKIGFVWDAQRGNLKMHSRYRKKLDEFCKSSSDEDDTSTKKEGEGDDTTDKKPSPCESSKATANLQQGSETSGDTNNPVVVAGPPNISNQPNAAFTLPFAMPFIPFGDGLQHLLASNAQLNNNLSPIRRAQLNNNLSPIRRASLIQLHATGSSLINDGASLEADPVPQNTDTNMLAADNLPNNGTDVSAMEPNHLSHGFASNDGAIQQEQMQGELDPPNIQATKPSKDTPQEE